MKTIKILLAILFSIALASCGGGGGGGSATPAAAPPPSTNFPPVLTAGTAYQMRLVKCTSTVTPSTGVADTSCSFMPVGPLGPIMADSVAALQDKLNGACKLDLPTVPGVTFTYSHTHEYGQTAAGEPTVTMHTKVSASATVGSLTVTTETSLDATYVIEKV